MFKPVTLDEVFNESDIQKLKDIISSNKIRRTWYDYESQRALVEHDDLEQYFSKKLEPIARAIFNDPTLKTSFSMYAKYDNQSSWLAEHTDKYACVYTLDYCLSAKIPWALTVDQVDYPIQKNQALAFMGMDSPHGRKRMSDFGASEVEMVFFHFVPGDHWYFTHCSDFYPANTN